MNTQPYAPTGNRRSFIKGGRIAFISVVAFILTLQPLRADIPDQPLSGEFRGMYQVSSSTDPIFPMQARQEWFLDFGKGISEGKFAGNVAVSLRQNPKVTVRILAWQYMPKQATLLIGNPYSEGSKKAVAKGVWQMRPTSDGVIFQRGNYQVVLRRADPNDY
jgi:hypothetical protein